MKNVLILTIFTILCIQANAQWTEEQKILAQLGFPFETEADDQMGRSVAIDGDYAIIGVPNGNNTIGMALIYRWDGMAWIEDEKLLPSDGAAFDQFGWSVAISGNTAIVGADADDDNGTISGSVYIFERSGGSWSQVAKLLPLDGAANDLFGHSLAISGSTVIVGAFGDDDNGSGSGSAYIFENSGGSWIQEAKLLPSDGTGSEQFGISVGISGSLALVGASLDDDNGTQSGSAYIFENSGGSWSQAVKLLPIDGAIDDRFGISVSISGDHALVGAQQDDDNGSNSGSAYVFENSGGTWPQVAKLTASDGTANDRFGYSVSISNSTALVGAYLNTNTGIQTGSAYIYENDGGMWTQQVKLTASDGEVGDKFGLSVSISGTSALVGAFEDDDNGTNSGSAYIFENSGGTWSEVTKLLPSNDVSGDRFGYSVAISGTTAIVGAIYDDENAINSGSAYIFELSEGTWIRTAKLLPSDGGFYSIFGTSVAISGTIAIVGSDDDSQVSSGAAYIFELSGETWSETAKLLPSDGPDIFFGRSVAISGTTALVGSSWDGDNGTNSGSAYVYEGSGGTWSQTAKLLPADGAQFEEFGSSVAISGTTALVGAVYDDDNGFKSGSAYVFEFSGGTWNQAAKLLPLDGSANDWFGISVAISGTTALVGAPRDDVNGENSGSAYVFELSSGTWSQAAKFLPLDGVPLDYFGRSVAISGPRAIVGSFDYNFSPNGDNTSSAYVFEFSSEIWSQAAKILPLNGAADDYFGYSVAISGKKAIIGAVFDDEHGNNSGSAYIFSNSACDLPTISVDATNVPCAGSAAGMINLNTTGGFGEFTYSIDGGTNTQSSNSFSSLVAGNYTATVIVDGDPSCVANLPFEITEPPVLDASCTLDTNTTCFGDSDGSASVSVTGGTPIIDYFQIGIDIDGENSNNLSGYSVALSDDGSRVAIGARNNNNNGFEAGHVRVYDWNGSSWVQAGNDIDGEASNDHSGNSVSLSSDGQILAIGASDNNGQGTNSGHVRVYEWVGSDWQQKGLDINGESSNDESGHSVSLSSDGLTLAIGAIFNSGNGGLKGHVRVYEWNGSTWLQKGVDINGEGSNDQSGHSVSLSSNGLTLAIGAIFNDGNGSNAGHVRIYEWSGSAWVQKGLDIDGEGPDDRSGYSVSLSSDGQTVAIGAILNQGNNSGHVRVYEFNGGAWQQKGMDIDGEGSGDESGFSVSLSSDGQTLAVGAWKNSENGFNAGHVRVYQWSGSDWLQTGMDINGEAAEDRSGFSVSLSSDGSTLAIGAIYNNGNGFESGHVRVYQSPNPYTILWSNGNTTATADSLSAGTYSVVVTDANNCTATCEVIILGDTEIPVISCPSNLTDTTAIGDLDLVVNFSDPTAIDNCSAVSLVCIPASGSAFPIGTTTVTCTATDGSGNEASCTFDITVEGAASCPTDFNSTGTTDGADFGIFLGNFGLVCTMPPCPTDLNVDGITDGQDFGIFLGNFGLDCP